MFSVIIMQYCRAVLEMLEERTREFDRQLSVIRDEYSATKEKLARVSGQETALVQQNAKMSIQLVAEERRQKQLESELSDLKTKLESNDAEIAMLKSEAKDTASKHNADTKLRQQDLDEKNRILKEYQEKVTGSQSF